MTFFTRNMPNNGDCGTQEFMDRYFENQYSWIVWMRKSPFLSGSVRDKHSFKSGYAFCGTSRSIDGGGAAEMQTLEWCRLSHWRSRCATGPSKRFRLRRRSSARKQNDLKISHQFYMVAANGLETSHQVYMVAAVRHGASGGADGPRCARKTSARSTMRSRRSS